MTSSHTRSITAALLAVVAVAACGGATPGAAQAHSHTHAQSAPADSGRWTQADVHFMSAMIGHHAQAIEMARLAPTHGASPSIRTLAERIINAQHDEIATMQRWLRDRGQPVPDPEHAAMDMAEHGAGHDGLMPGMLTPEQMARLEAASGTEFDRLFLTFMIQHHRGATEMVSRLFGSWGAAQDETVFKFASDVNVDQTTEIDRMQRMLASVIFGSPSP
jgi:uncharacterized protein (DUF305 family)